MRRLLICIWLLTLPALAEFRVPPYLQNPTQTSMTVIWFSDQPVPGQLSWQDAGGQTLGRLESRPRQTQTLSYAPIEVELFFQGKSPAPPYQHQLTLTGLRPGAEYSYQVQQGKATYRDRFHTPHPDQKVRFVAFADCETEPESREEAVKWPDAQGNERLYPVTQTVGFEANLEVIRSRKPDFLVIAGDLVESGGEQRDWDEFFRHMTALEPSRSVLGSIPLFASPGNHEYYGGPKNGGYGVRFSESSMAKFLTYFKNPDAGRYYSVRYGPVTLIVLDSTNGRPDNSAYDTNFYLGAEETGSPGIEPDSPQIRWLEKELQRCQDSPFTFVAFHHCPYSVGTHGRPPGKGKGLDPQSGVPLRHLTPLFHRYRVDALLCGHDEMFERSEVAGPEGEVLQVYSVGVGGDGLRPPGKDVKNPYQKFLAHLHAPEQWQGAKLVDGGRHYGHLEVDLRKSAGGAWEAVLTPVYVFPVMDESGKVVRFERRVYDDVVKLKSRKI